ncbi:MAG: trigger factor [Candidatus Komeilibacteria bacterium]|nr:trigger factor [Candidatus Komeilibacteria bacterium]
MQVNKKELKPSELELTIQISPAEYQPYLEKAANRLSQSSKIEGFRPGKAPYDLVKQRFGEMAIYQEALDNIVSHFFYLAVTQEKLNTVAQPKIDLEKLAPGNPIIFKAVVALMPSVKLKDYKSVKVARKEVKVAETEVAKVLEDLKKMQAKEVLAERPAQQGDRVEVDFEVSLDKVVIEGGSGKKYPLIIGDKTMIPGFEEELVGLTKDQEKTFQLKFPEEYQNKMVAGKNCDFKVKLLSVYDRQLPPATDDWAKTLGAKDLNGLTADIKKNLADEQKFHEEQRVETELLNKIVEQAEFSEIPEVLVESEAHRMVHEFSDSITQQGLDFNNYLANIKKAEKDLVEDFKPKAMDRVKTSLVIKEIADAEKIEASPAEIKAETEKILTQVAGNQEAADNITSEGYQHYLQTILRNKQVIEMLKKECVK